MKMLQTILLSLTVLISLSALAHDDGRDGKKNKDKNKQFSDMVVFGDSLSDPGNVFVLTGMVSVRPYDAGNIPSAPYPQGGKTFTNGKTWAQQVSKSLKLKSGKGPALKSPKFLNYAFGAARAAPSAGGPFDMSAQISQYLSDTGGVADREALYAVYFGGNDVRDALVAFNVAFQQTLLSGGTQPEALAAGQATAEAVLAEAITAIADNIIVLSLAGAQKFIVPNVANLGLVPAITELGPNTIALATALSVGFNLALENTLSTIEQAFHVDITRFDVFELMSAIVADPESYNLENSIDACLTPEVKKGAVCKHPNDYFFWDGIHPTRVVHRILAKEALSVLQ